MLEWFAEFTCGDCGSSFAMDRRGLWYASERLTCPECRTTLNFDNSAWLVLVAELLSRVMPYLYWLYESVTFDCFVPGPDGVYVAVRFVCKHCGLPFEIGDQQARMIAQRGGAMQCPRCKPLRSGRLLVRDLFHYWPAVPQGQRAVLETGWTMRLVPDDRKSPRVAQLPDH